MLAPTPLLTRALIYGCLGWAIDRAFTTITRSARRHRFSAPDAGLQLAPIYALAAPLFEPTHHALRTRPVTARALTYGLGFVAVEYAIGALLRKVFGRAPWDYTGSRFSVRGLTRVDYVPLWAVAGLALEPLHDRLTRT